LSTVVEDYVVALAFQPLALALAGAGMPARRSDLTIRFQRVEQP
jgi:hypothetical protein